MSKRPVTYFHRWEKMNGKKLYLHTFLRFMKFVASTEFQILKENVNIFCEIRHEYNIVHFILVHNTAFVLFLQILIRYKPKTYVSISYVTSWTKEMIWENSHFSYIKDTLLTPIVDITCPNVMIVARKNKQTLIWPSFQWEIPETQVLAISHSMNCKKCY